MAFHRRESFFRLQRDFEAALDPVGDRRAHDFVARRRVVTVVVEEGLSALGDPSTAAVVLQSSGMPPATTALAIRGTARVNGGLGLAFGDGLLCVTGSVVRLGVSTTAQGAATFPVSHGAGPGAFHYQIWYRNTPSTFCDAFAAYNLSNGQRVTW